MRTAAQPVTTISPSSSAAEPRKLICVVGDAVHTPGVGYTKTTSPGATGSSRVVRVV
jgi:hypothetical protein